jgi:DGQHR domain-containing protein
VVDGQHRIGGLKHAMEEIEGSGLGQFTVPVVITEDMDKFDEMLQFYVINTEQKKIRTDLANRLLQQQARNEEGFTRILEQGAEWKIRATAVTDQLNANPNSVWCGRIQAPNQRKSANHVMKEISFSTSLRPVVGGSSLLARGLHVGQVTELLARYWNALAELLPQAFQNQDEYVIQKTPGVFSLHSIFPLIFELSRQSGQTITVEAFRDVVRPMIEAEDGAEFWRGDNDEGASQYGSMKGFRILASRLEGHLPRIEVTI